MGNKPTFEQIEDAVSRSTSSSYGPDGGIEYISPFLAAVEVEKLYAPVLAELEKARDDLLSAQRLAAQAYLDELKAQKPGLASNITAFKIDGAKGVLRALGLEVSE